MIVFPMRTVCTFHQLRLISGPYFPPETHLDVQMYNVFLVHVLQAIADLFNVVDHFSFCHFVVLVGDTVKQFTTGQTEWENT